MVAHAIEKELMIEIPMNTQIIRMMKRMGYELIRINQMNIIMI